MALLKQGPSLLEAPSDAERDEVHVFSCKGANHNRLQHQWTFWAGKTQKGGSCIWALITRFWRRWDNHCIVYVLNLDKAGSTCSHTHNSSLTKLHVFSYLHKRVWSHTWANVCATMFTRHPISPRQPGLRQNKHVRPSRQGRYMNYLSLWSAGWPLCFVKVRVCVCMSRRSSSPGPNLGALKGTRSGFNHPTTNTCKCISVAVIEQWWLCMSGRFITTRRCVCVCVCVWWQVTQNPVTKTASRHCWIASTFPQFFCPWKINEGKKRKKIDDVISIIPAIKLPNCNINTQTIDINGALLGEIEYWCEGRC